MRLLFLLFSWVTFLAQTNYPIYIDQNGLTVKAAPDAVIGETYELEGKTSTSPLEPVSVPVFESDFNTRLAEFMKTKPQPFLTKDELDELLKIENLTFESQKTKSAQLIKRINEHYPGLIERVRNPEDKRVFIYQVNI